jgi:DNA topoisomerase VI subunit B
MKTTSRRMMHKLERTIFETSRAAEYFSADELLKQTGVQSSRRFGDVVVKELADNALDAAEAAGVTPHVEVDCRERAGLVEISVSDNGPGIAPTNVRKILNFTTRTSDKAAYRSPTRGAQGNALKTVVGMPHALGCSEPVVVEAQGVRHTIKARIDPAGELKLLHQMEESAWRTGTAVTVLLPTREVDNDATYWAAAISLFNPHAFVKLEHFGEAAVHANLDDSETSQIYKPTVDDIKKYRPTDPTSPHWYNKQALGKLIGAYIGAARNGGRNLPLGEFVRQFKGLTSTAKAKAVCSNVRPEHLLDFEVGDHEIDMVAVSRLLDTMKEHTTPPTHRMLGRIGGDHFEQRFNEMYDVIRFGYKHVQGFLPYSGLPYIFEFAVAETEGCHEDALFYGVNYSPVFADPLEDIYLVAPEYSARGIQQCLIEAFAHSRWKTTDDPGPETFTAVAAHVITPAPLFLSKGKTRLDVKGV